MTTTRNHHRAYGAEPIPVALWCQEIFELPGQGGPAVRASTRPRWNPPSESTSVLSS